MGVPEIRAHHTKMAEPIITQLCMNCGRRNCLQPNSDLGVEHAWESARSCMSISGTRGPTYSESVSFGSTKLVYDDRMQVVAVLNRINVGISCPPVTHYMGTRENILFS